MRGVIGGSECGRDRVPIGEIDSDRLDSGNRPARKRTHPPALPFQFHSHRVADDAAATGDEGYAPRIAVRHVEPPGCKPNTVRTLKARSSRRRRRDQPRQRSCSRRKLGIALRAAISSGRPRRLSGVAALKLARIASAPSFVAACASMMGVSIAPGLIVLTRMPRSLSSAVHVRTNERTLAFVAL